MKATSSANNRRDFLKKTGVLTATLGLAGSSAFALATGGDSSVNPLPRWKGFNLLDFFSPDPVRTRSATTEDDFKWMTDW